jgi:hypothetical protein
VTRVIITLVSIGLVLGMIPTKASAIPTKYEIANAVYMEPDVDGWVYEYEYCDGYEASIGFTQKHKVDKWIWVTFPAGWWYNTETQESYWYEKSEGWIPPGVHNEIYYDTCEMEEWGAGPNDYWNLYYHEQAHSRGLDHGDEPREENDAYNSSIQITGR